MNLQICYFTLLLSYKIKISFLISVIDNNNNLTLAKETKSDQTRLYSVRNISSFSSEAENSFYFFSIGFIVYLFI